MQEVTRRIFGRSGIEKLPAHLESRYGVRVASVTSLDAGVLRVDRNDSLPWVARVFPAERTIEAAEGDAEVLRFLEENDYPAERCARPDAVSSLEGQAVLVTEYADGPKADRSVSTLHTLGELLGRLQALPARSGAVTREAGSLHHWSVQGGGPAEDIAAALSWLRSIEPEVTAEHREQYETLRDHVAHTDNLNDLPQALVHPDFHSENVIATPDGGLVVIDWTGAGRGPRIAPLAFLLWRGSLRPGGWDPERVDAIVAGYRSHVRLETEEFTRLAGAMLKAPLVFDCFQFCMGRMTLPATVAGLAATSDLAAAIAARAREAFGTG